MKQQHSIKGRLVTVLGKIALFLLGVSIALGMMELLLRTFPNWVPPEVRVNPPVRRVEAWKDETYTVDLSDGDLFYWMRETIVPLSPDQDQVVAHVHMITDAHGFRNPPPEKATYGIVALGDSFTRAIDVATPWPQILAEYTGINVLNLGDIGIGPQDELKILRQYGLEKKPRWVILAYFEGNDLYDAGTYDQANPFILTRFGRYMLDRSVEAWQEKRLDGAQLAAIPTYRYPITITINKNQLEIVFFSSYISWLSLSEEAIAASQNYLLMRETILQVQELSQAAGARFLLVYVPSKEHVYVRYLNDADILARVFTDVPAIELDAAGFLKFASERATPELTRQHMDDQAGLLAKFAVEHNIRFLDLTPIFQEKAGVGAELYYPFDTHWNQLGHDLAAETIYYYIKGMLPYTVSKTPGH